MAELIAAADLSLCAGGATMWERYFLGLPSITVIFADNQEQTTLDVAKKEAIMYLGWASKLDRSDYTAAILTMISNPDKMLAMSKNALQLMGGTKYQGTVAVANAML